MKDIKKILFIDGKIALDSEVYLNFKNDFTYHSSKIEGSTISSEENMDLVTKKIKKEELAKTHELKYVLENIHLLDVFDYVLKTFSEPLTENYIKKLHEMLCFDSPDLGKRHENAGQYRNNDVRVGNHIGTRPFAIAQMMRELIKLDSERMDLLTIAKFHCEFETIHPFYDGNGRTGRMIMLKQCLKNDIPSFFVNDLNKREYYNSLAYYNLTMDAIYMFEYCSRQQEYFENKYSKYFK
jgi:Fic family protein